MAYSLAYMVTDDCYDSPVWQTADVAMQQGRDKRSVSATSPRNVVAVRILDHNNVAHHVVRADACEKVGKLICDPKMVVADVEPFWEFARGGVKVHYRTGMVGFARLLNTTYPAANFLVQPFHEQIVLTKAGLGPYRESIALFCWSYDLTSYGAIMWAGDVSDISRLVSKTEYIHCIRSNGSKSKWMAFKSLDDAVTVKLMFDSCTVFKING